MDHSEHNHPLKDFGRAFKIAIALNTAFVAVEVFYGFLAHSMALVADAGHNLFDVFSLVLSWWAAALARRQTDERYTYGLRSSSILAALANAILLIVACGMIAWEALGRLFGPVNVAGASIVVVAAIGIVINGLSAWLFLAGRKADLNIRAAFWHMAADALVSMGVVVCGWMILETGWYWIDPAAGLLIVAIILGGTWGLLRDSVNLGLQAVPSHIDIQQVRQYLSTRPGVREVHDLHIWGMSTTENALTAHLLMPGGHPGDAFLEEIKAKLAQQFAIHHSTLQIDLGENHTCTLDQSP